MSSYAGETVLIRFVFGSDSFYSGNEEGWYIDDVRITPETGEEEWVLAEPSAGTLPPAAGTSMVLTITSDELVTGSDRRAVAAINSTAPVEPTRKLPVALQVRTPSTVNLLSAEQTSTNGSGQVTIELNLYNPDAEPVDVEWHFSTNNGASWASAWITAVNASVGAPAITTPDLPQVTNIATVLNDVAITNALSSVWSSTNSPAIELATNTRVRVRAWDGYFWSSNVMSAAFLVDNQAPAPPGALTSTSHVVDTWTDSSTLAAEWPPADDGQGAGVAGYGTRVAQGMTNVPSTVSTTNLSLIADALADGTNWWIGVRAIDAFGNVGEPVWLGPLRIDATPPDPADAEVVIEQSPLGAYTFQTTLTNSWSGFIDTASGITGYFLSLQDGGGTTNGTFSSNQTAALEGAVPDQTNIVYVWAQDAAGNRGQAAHAPILVLSEDADWDGNGMSNRDEDIAGLSAIDPEQVFDGEASHTGSDEPTLSWPYAAGRVYTIHWSNDALGAGMTWSSVSLTPADYVVENGIVTWTDPAPISNPAGRRFYRIEVQVDD